MRFLFDDGQVFHHLGAAGAQVGVLGVAAHGGEHLPAASALAAVGGPHGHGLLRAHVHADLGDDEQVGQRLGIHVRQEGILGGDGQVHLGLQALADGLIGAGLLQRAVDNGAEGGDKY